MSKAGDVFKESGRVMFAFAGKHASYGAAGGHAVSFPLRQHA